MVIKHCHVSMFGSIECVHGGHVGGLKQKKMFA